MKKSLYNYLHIIFLSFREESKRIIKDPGVMLICFGAIIIYQFVYSFAYQNNVVHELPIAVIDKDNTALSRSLTRTLDASAQLKIDYKTGNFEQAKDLFYQDKIKGIIYIPANLEKKILRREQGKVMVYSDGSSFLLHKETLKSGIQSISNMSAQIEIKKQLLKGCNNHKAQTLSNPLNTQIIELYNPAGSYGLYIMPTIIIIILQQTLLVGIGMLGGTQNEKNNTELKGIFKRKPAAIYPAVIGKSLSYLLLYFFNAMISLYWVNSWYGYPNQCQFTDLLILLIPYILSATFLGLLLSNIFKKREHSILFIVFLSPIVLFVSGISWPIEAIPPVLYRLAQIFPGTQMVQGYMRLRTMGATLSDIKLEVTFLMLQCVVYYLLAVWTTRMAYRKRQKASIR